MTAEGKQIYGSTKKVKKRKADNNATMVTDEPTKEEVNYDDKSLREPKKKKRKKQKYDCDNGDMKTQKHEEVSEEIPPTLSKKKKKKKKKREDPEAVVDDLVLVEDAPATESAGKKKKKKKKDKQKHDKDEESSETERDVEIGEKCNIVEEQQFVEEPTRKKKSKHTGKHRDGEMTSEERSHKKKHKIKHDCTSGSSPVELNTNTDIECQPSESSSNNFKKKKKKKRNYEDEDVEQTEDALSVHDSQVDAKKKKKKKKHESKHIADDNTMVDNSTVSNGLQHDEDTPKLKKKKKHIGTDTDESNKGYNRLPFDYNSIDNGQCKKLTSRTLDNHDNCSEGTGQNQGDGSLDTKSGQWGTASFDNKERQQKFLRLLGGCKKGGSTESKPLFGKLGKLGGGCALNREEEASLNVKLETEFDRAMSFKLSKKKSGGLGFQAPPGEGKMFYIDKTSSKSIKFNDSD